MDRISIDRARGLSLRRIEVLMRRLKPNLDDRAQFSLQVFDPAAGWQGVVSRWPSGVAFGDKPGSLVWSGRRSGEKLKVEVLS